MKIKSESLLKIKAFRPKKRPFGVLEQHMRKIKDIDDNKTLESAVSLAERIMLVYPDKDLI